MERLFIIGIARTGSKIYMSILNDFSDIDIVNELHYMAPRIVRKDAIHALGLNKRNIAGEARVDDALKAMYAGTMAGDFWTVSGKRTDMTYRVTDIESQTLRKALLETEGTAKDVFRVLVDEHAKVAEKRRSGAKSPVDISCTHRLLEWFPDAKILHLIRDPRAIYTSMTVRDVPGADKPGLRRMYAMARRLPYLVSQVRSAMRLHEELKSSENYYISRFEDLMLRPETSLRGLCDFVGIEYRDEMNQVKRVDSSFARSSGTGFDKTTVDRWKRHILPIEQRLINAILSREIGEFGYDLA